MLRKVVLAAVAAAAIFAAPASAREPDTWEGLLKVESKGFDTAYLLPGADFTPYRQVMIDPPAVAFHRSWLRDYNDSVGLSDRISDEEALEILAEMQTGLKDKFVKAYADAGFEIVATPGPSVLRLQTQIINIWVVAPDTMSAGRTRTFSEEAGAATLVIEARDSMSGAMLARGIDKRTVGDSGRLTRRTRVSNRSDFEQVFTKWAKASVTALGALRSMTPINGEGQPQ
jgi:hypothetical protein